MCACDPCLTPTQLLLSGSKREAINKEIQSQEGIWEAKSSLK